MLLNLGGVEVNGSGGGLDLHDCSLADRKGDKKTAYNGLVRAQYDPGALSPLRVNTRVALPAREYGTRRQSVICLSEKNSTYDRERGGRCSMPGADETSRSDAAVNGNSGLSKNMVAHLITGIPPVKPLKRRLGHNPLSG